MNPLSPTPKSRRSSLSVPLKVLELRGEESAWYGRNYIGSKSIFGLLTKEDLNEITFKLDISNC